MDQNIESVLRENAVFFARIEKPEDIEHLIIPSSTKFPFLVAVLSVAR